MPETVAGLDVVVVGFWVVDTRGIPTDDDGAAGTDDDVVSRKTTDVETATDETIVPVVSEDAQEGRTNAPPSTKTENKIRRRR